MGLEGSYYVGGGVVWHGDRTSKPILANDESW